MDIRCPKCGEPWDIDSLHENDLEVPFDEAYLILRQQGCGVLFGTSGCPAKDPSPAFEVIAELLFLAGDDVDGAASFLEDAEQLGLFA